MGTNIGPGNVSLDYEEMMGLMVEGGGEKEASDFFVNNGSCFFLSNSW